MACFARDKSKPYAGSGCHGIVLDFWGGVSLEGRDFFVMMGGGREGRRYGAIYIVAGVGRGEAGGLSQLVGLGM